MAGMTGFDVCMQLNSKSRHVSVTATDLCNGTQYSAGGGNFAYALYKLILKICKSQLRPYTPREIERLEITK